MGNIEGNFHAWVYDTRENTIIDNHTKDSEFVKKQLHNILDWSEEERGEFIKKYYNRYDNGDFREQTLNSIDYEYVYKETDEIGEKLTRTIRKWKRLLNKDIRELGKEEALEKWREKYNNEDGYCLQQALIIWKTDHRRYKLKFGSFGIKRKDNPIENVFFILTRDIITRLKEDYERNWEEIRKRRNGIYDVYNNTYWIWKYDSDTER